MNKKKTIILILLLAVLYVIWPIDLLPLNPADDLAVVLGSALTSAIIALKS